jgi:hypothetical protein
MIKPKVEIRMYNIFTLAYRSNVGEVFPQKPILKPYKTHSAKLWEAVQARRSIQGRARHAKPIYWAIAI